MDENVYKIFVKEDDQNIWKKLLESVLKDSNITYELIWDDKEFFKNLDKIDLIICDYFLSKDGEIRGDDWVRGNVFSKDPDIPVIFWTASMNPHIIKSTIVGSEVFFKKELKIKEFKEAVDNLIEQRRLDKYYTLYNPFFNNQIKKSDYRKVLNAIYLNSSRLLESFFGQSKFHAVFNAHGIIHIQRVIDNLSLLLKYGLAVEKCNYFTEDEYVCVYLAALLHDMGMILDVYREDIEFEEFQEIRKQHCIRIFDWMYNGTILKKLDLEDELLSVFKEKAILKTAAFIALYHDSMYEFDHFPHDNNTLQTALKGYNEKLHNQITQDNDYLSCLKQNTKIRILAGLLALADKMDYGKTRTPVKPIRTSNLRSIRDEFEYIKNEIITHFDIKSEDNKKEVIFYINYENDINKIQLDNTKDKKYFEYFEEELLKNDGKINDKCLEAVISSLKDEMQVKLWENIKQALPIENSSRNFGYFSSIKLEKDPNPNKQPKWEITLPHINEGIAGTEELNWQEKALINHIFPSDKYRMLNLSKVAEGFSGDKVFYVKFILLNTYNEQKIHLEGQNKFLKIGKYKDIHNEVSNYKKIGVPHLSPKSIIGHIEEFKYLDYGGYVGSIIEDDEAKIVSLNKFVKKNPEQLFEYIVKAFNLFYQNIKPFKDNNIVIKDYYFLVDSKLRKIDDLKGLNFKLSEQKNYLLRFKSMLEKIQAKKIDLHSSLKHGDFTFRNILKSSGNLVFIDFAESGLGHYFFDFAKLDHYLRFEFLEKFDGEYQILEENILSKDHRIKDKIFFRTLWTIYDWLIDRSPEVKENFEMELFLAASFMHIWSIPYRDNTINLEFNSRLSFADFYLSKLEKLLKMKK